MPLSERDIKALLEVHEYYLDLLKGVLGHELGLPIGVDGVANASNDAERQQHEISLRNWLDLLDLAITAPMLRDSLRVQPNSSLITSLLYRYVSKTKHTETDRDKADFVVTLLFRTPEANARWDSSGQTFGSSITPPFEKYLVEILGMKELPFLPAEHEQIAREFEYVCEEIEDFRHFDQLMDSGIMQKARDLKHSLGASFYHPRILATIAAYNLYFGRRFDELFHAATKQIKEFAERLQAEGGSVMARVDGDVIVKQLADVQENKILQTEYGRAQEQLRMLSKFKKAVDVRRGTKDSAAAAAAKPSLGGPASAPSPVTEPGVAPISAPLGAALSTSLEEIKFTSMADSIRNYVRGTVSKETLEVPVGRGTLLLTSGEADAFRADFTKEKSFRAEMANVLIADATLLARMSLELADFKAKRNSAYLWKPHADSLSHLLNLSQDSLAKAQEMVDLADSRGLKDKAEMIRASMERVREQILTVARALQTMGTNQAGTY